MTSTIRRPGVRAARAGFLAAPLVGLAVAVGLVWQSSYAAFSDTTDNGVNNWRAGSVTISDTDGGGVGSAMFSLTDDGALKPGSTRTRCIEVTKEGSLASTVKLYGSGLTATNELSSGLDLVVRQGTGTVTNGACTSFTADGTSPTVYTGTLAGFTATTFGGGHGNWAPAAGSQTRVFEFKYTVNSNVHNDAQGDTAAVTFVWEAQNS
jgi:hypothetical protein